MVSLQSARLLIKLKVFSRKKQKRKKRKHSFCIVKYDVSWGSQCSTNKRWWSKKAMIFPIFCPWIFVKNRCKTVAKACRTIICTKIYKKTRLESDFSAKSQFLTDFGNPSGSPERSKRDEHHWEKLLPGRIWCNFVALQAWLSLPAPFRLPSGTILTQRWHTQNCLPAVLVPWVSVVRRNARSALNPPPLWPVSWDNVQN